MPPRPDELSGPSATMGRVTSTVTPPELRERAEAVLTTLAGPGRPAARRPVDGHPRAGRATQRGRWSCSAPAGASRRSTSWPPRCCGPQGAGPTVIVSPLLALMRNQIDAAARAGIHAVTVNSANTGDWERTYAAVEAGEVDVLLVSPERLNNPDFRDRVLPRLTATRRHARRRRGALRVRLGPRLPARLPAAARADRRAARRASRCWPPRPPPTTGWSSTSPSSSGWAGRIAATAGRWCCAARSTGRACGCRWCRCATPAQRLGWLAAQLDALPGAGIVYTLTDRRRRGGGRVPARARPPGRVLHRQDRPGGAAGRRGRPAGQPGQGAGGHQRAGHGLRQARPRVRRAPRGAGLAGGLLPADRPGRPRRRAGRGGAAARPRGPRHLGLLRLAGLPAGAAGAPDPAGARSDASRCPPRPSRRASTCPAPGWRCCSRCSTATARCGGSRAAGSAPAQEWVYDERAAPAHRRGPPRRAAGDARLHRHRRVPAGVPAPPARRPGTPDAVRALRQLRRPGLEHRRRRRSAAAAAEERIARPGVEVRAAQAVAERHGASWACRCPGGSRPASWPNRAG